MRRDWLFKFLAQNIISAFSKHMRMLALHSLEVCSTDITRLGLKLFIDDLSALEEAVR